MDAFLVNRYAMTLPCPFMCELDMEIHIIQKRQIIQKKKVKKVNIPVWASPMICLTRNSKLLLQQSKVSAAIIPAGKTSSSFPRWSLYAFAKKDSKAVHYADAVALKHKQLVAVGLFIMVTVQAGENQDIKSLFHAERHCQRDRITYYINSVLQPLARLCIMTQSQNALLVSDIWRHFHYNLVLGKKWNNISPFILSSFSLTCFSFLSPAGPLEISPNPLLISISFSLLSFPQLFTSMPLLFPLIFLQNVKSPSSLLFCHTICQLIVFYNRVQSHPVDLSHQS